jgi:hypothetical protein
MDDPNQPDEGQKKNKFKLREFANKSKEIVKKSSPRGNLTLLSDIYERSGNPGRKSKRKSSNEEMSGAPYNGDGTSGDNSALEDRTLESMFKLSPFKN